MNLLLVKLVSLQLRLQKTLNSIENLIKQKERNNEKCDESIFDRQFQNRK